MTPWEGEVCLKCLQLQKIVMSVTQMKQNDQMIVSINRLIWYNIWSMLNKTIKFAVKLLDCDPIIPLFDTGAACSSILYQIFMKMSDKVDIIRKHYK